MKEFREKSEIILVYMEELRHRLQVLEFLDYGYLYEFRSAGNGFVGMVELLYKDTVDFDMFVMEEYTRPLGSTFTYNYMTDLKRIEASDLPLYIGWGWKSAKYLAYLAGTENIRLKPGEVI